MIFFAQQSCSFYFCLPEHLISFPPTDLPAVTPVNCVNKGIFVGLNQNFRSLQWQFTQLREFSNNMFCQWLQRPCFTTGFFFSFYYFLMSSVPRSTQPQFHRHGAGRFPTFSHASHARFLMGFSKLDFQKQLRSLFQWFLECLASHAWKKPGCQQQACSAFHKSDGRTNIILEFINVL